MENIEDLSLAELKELAKDKGVKNISKLIEMFILFLYE